MANLDDDSDISRTYSDEEEEKEAEFTSPSLMEQNLENEKFMEALNAYKTFEFLFDYEIKFNSFNILKLVGENNHYGIIDYVSELAVKSSKRKELSPGDAERIYENCFHQKERGPKNKLKGHEIYIYLGVMKHMIFGIKDYTPQLPHIISTLAVVADDFQQDKKQQTILIDWAWFHYDTAFNMNEKKEYSTKKAFVKEIGRMWKEMSKSETGKNDKSELFYINQAFKTGTMTRSRQTNVVVKQSMTLRNEGASNNRRHRVEGGKTRRQANFNMTTASIRPPTTNTLRGLRMLAEIEEAIMGKDPNQVVYV